jgi:hypothetical protein
MKRWFGFLMMMLPLLACNIFQSCSPILKILVPSELYLDSSESYPYGVISMLVPSTEAFRADVLYGVEVWAINGTLTVDATDVQVKQNPSGHSVEIIGFFPQVNSAFKTLQYVAPPNLTKDTIAVYTRRYAAFDLSLVEGFADATRQTLVYPRVTATPNQPPLLKVPVSVSMFSYHTEVSLFSDEESVIDIDAKNADVSVRLETDFGILSLTTGESVRIYGAKKENAFKYVGQSLSIIGSLKQVNSVLGQIEYIPGTDKVNIDEVRIFVDDLGNTGAGGPKTAEASILVIRGGQTGVSLPIQSPEEAQEDKNLVVFPPANPANPNIICEHPNEVVIMDMVAGNGVWYFGTYFNIPITLETVRFWGRPSDLLQTVPLLLPPYQKNGDDEDAVQVIISDASGEQTLCSSVLKLPPKEVYQNQPPRNIVPSSQSVSAGGSIALPMSVTDPDIGVGFMDVRLQAQAGILSVTAAGGAQVTGNGSQQVDIKAVIGDMKATLNSVVYTNTNSGVTTDTVTIFSNDRGNNGAGGQKTDKDTVMITIVPTASAPTTNNNPVAPSAPSNACTGAPVSLSGGSYTCDLGNFCSYSPSLSGGQAPYSWSYSGTLPPGMSFNNGTVSGTIGGSGNYPYVVTVSDCAGNSASANMEIYVGKP